MLNLLSTMPYVVSKYKSKALANEMQRLLAAETFDLVQLEFLYMGHYISIPQAKGIPILLRQHNVETVVWERLARKGGGLISLYAKIQAPKIRRFEKQVCEQVDACLAITEADAQTFQAMSPKIRTFVVPSGVDLKVYKPCNEAEELYTLAYVGSMDYFPNEDAVLWFTKEIYPKIKAQAPETKFYIVGRSPSAVVQKLSNGEDIIVTGTVEDVQMYIRQAAVFLVPLRVGGGIRIKILQALAMGKTVVSTSIGAQGIGVTAGQNIVLADTAEDFSQSVVNLLRNRGKRQQIGQNARQFVEQYYGWDAIIDELEEIYHRLVNAKLIGSARL